MRLIDADGLIKMIQEQAGCDKCDNYEGVKCRACQWDDMIATVEDYADNHPEAYGMNSMYKVGDKVLVEIESITNEQIDRCATWNTQPFTLYKLKGIPMYLAEEDFLNAVVTETIVED